MFCPKQVETEHKWNIYLLTASGWCFSFKSVISFLLAISQIVYYAVRNGALNRTDYVSVFKGLNGINNANSRSHNHFCNGNAALTSVRIDDVHVTVNKMLWLLSSRCVLLLKYLQNSIQNTTHNINCVLHRHVSTRRSHHQDPKELKPFGIPNVRSYFVHFKYGFKGSLVMTLASRNMSL